MNIGLLSLPALLLVNALAGEGEAMRQRALGGLEPPPYRCDGPLVSVIIPTLNEEDFLPLLLTSIRNQTYQPIEVVVADSSTDNSPEVARSFGVTVVTVPELNVSRARNEGARAARGDILVFMDADCILEPPFVEKLVRMLNQGAVLAHGTDCIYDSGWRNLWEGFSRNLKPRLFTTGRGVAIRRTDFFKVGGYDEGCDPTKGCREDLLFGQDVESTFGPGSVVLDRDALVATSARRPIRLGGVWRERGWRDHVIPVEAR